MRRAFQLLVAGSVGFWIAVAVEHLYDLTLHAPARLKKETP